MGILKRIAFEVVKAGLGVDGDIDTGDDFVDTDTSSFLDIDDDLSMSDGVLDIEDAPDDYNRVTDLAGENHFVDSLNDGYNVSFSSQKTTLKSVGGIKLDAIIDKEPGTANRFCINTSKGTVHDVPGGTHSVKINGIVYLLPKLIG